MDVVQYISENFKNDITLKEVAERKGYNYQYLSRTFNRTFGIGFRKMLSRCRMDYACSLLRETDLPIAQVAFESGFRSIRSFDHVCLETFGRSPKEIRRDERSG